MKAQPAAGQPLGEDRMRAGHSSRRWPLISLVLVASLAACGGSSSSSGSSSQPTAEVSAVEVAPGLVKIDARDSKAGRHRTIVNYQLRVTERSSNATVFGPTDLNGPLVGIVLPEGNYTALLQVTQDDGQSDEAPAPIDVQSSNRTCSDCCVDDA